MKYENMWFFSFPLLKENPKKYVESLRNMKTREDDVLLITFPKCGMSSKYEFVSIYQNNQITFLPTSKYE